MVNIISYKKSIELRENAYKKKYNIDAIDKKMLSEFEMQETIDKLVEYNVPLEEREVLLLHSPSWAGKMSLFNDLNDKLNDWEELLERAEHFNIDWYHYDYDPLGIKMVIEEMEREEKKEYDYFLNEYRYERGLI